MERLENSKVKLTFTYDEKKLNEAINEAYKKERSRFNIQGFRKGHAPRPMIENIYGKDIFYEGAIDELWPGAIREAMEEHDIDPIGRPSIDIEEISHEKGVTFSIETEVYPEVELGEYKGLEVAKTPIKVTKEQITKTLKDEQDRRARYVLVERAIQDGDRVLFDYKGKVDGEYFEGGSQEQATLDIGSGRFIPGFEEGMIGKIAKEDDEISVTFPEEYQAEDLAGKEAIFEVSIHEVREKELPEIDDDLAKDASEFDTLKEWEADIKETLQEQLQTNEDNRVKNELLKLAADNATLEIPEAMIENQVQNMVREFEQSLLYQGMNIEMYAQMMGVDVDEIENQFEPEARIRCKNQLVIDGIVKKEKFSASDDEIEEKIKEFAERYGRDLDEFKETLTDRDREYLGEDIAIEKALEFLVKEAKIVEKKEEKPAKKEKSAEADKKEEKPKKEKAEKADVKKTENAKKDEKAAKTEKKTAKKEEK